MKFFFVQFPFFSSTKQSYWPRVCCSTHLWYAGWTKKNLFLFYIRSVIKFYRLFSMDACTRLRTALWVNVSNDVDSNTIIPDFHKSNSLIFSNSTGFTRKLRHGNWNDHKRIDEKKCQIKSFTHCVFYLTSAHFIKKTSDKFFNDNKTEANNLLMPKNIHIIIK